MMAFSLPVTVEYFSEKSEAFLFGATWQWLPAEREALSA
jgi:hypothetical protein